VAGVAQWPPEKNKKNKKNKKKKLPAWVFVLLKH
jgi:hypothetical protein